MAVKNSCSQEGGSLLGLVGASKGLEDKLSHLATDVGSVRLIVEPEIL